MDFRPSLVYSLPNLNIKVSTALNQLQKQLDDCNKRIDEKKSEEIYNDYVKIFSRPQDIAKILISFFGFEKDSQQALLDSSHKRLSISEIERIFSKKTVLLLISDVEHISIKEITALDMLYKEQAQAQAQTKADSKYEIIWVPMDIWATTKWDEVDKQTISVPWYTLKDPSLIKPEAIKYIKEYWQHKKKDKNTGETITIKSHKFLVALGSTGKLHSPDALPMIWVWGNSAYPFTADAENPLREKQISLTDEAKYYELFFDVIDKKAADWIRAQNYVCLYGSDNIEWIQRFTSAAKEVAKEVQVNLELIYVGKRKESLALKENIEFIEKNKISHSLSSTAIWWFWKRLETILFINTRIDVDDGIMKEVMTLLALDGADSGWALFCIGSARTAKIYGDVDTILKKILASKQLVEDVSTIGFVAALEKHFQQHPAKHCLQIELPEGSEEIKQKMFCFVCGQRMMQCLVYKCCKE